ncbi:RNA methyltransferase [Candidatus Puniceispirillum sp.]|jgi:RNA methyltransferase, TrmH family|uniref:TrmH family RNA methyltransferase n=1 Tax=Candidatus Puniceispirillum sp. TaxID=2026719 RepID=UPI001ECBD310|nr:RNA methyltransferase [Candidatus Puniceispirillum sp.]MBT6566024.1 RNA methyltransferase [Candidatus Puniceispirillum sp.]
MKSTHSIHIPESITSTANAEVKFLRALHERKYRRQSGWFLAEGTRICNEAVALGWEMHRLAFLGGRENEPHVRSLLDALDHEDGRALPMSEKLLQRISRKDNPQMLLGAFRQKWVDLDSIYPDLSRPWIALDRVRDPGNLGTIMRSADAVGAKGIILIDDCTDPYSVEAVRASMGAIFNVEIAQCNQSDFLEFTQRWIGNQGQIIGTALPASIDYREADYRGALMILMGNEQAGLPPTLMQACTQLIRLPMLGRSDSLNLAVATGITLYEALRHKR